MIPKIIHQTWKDENVPYDVYDPRWVQSWRKYHPDWEYRLWTDAMIAEETERHFPTLLPLLDDGSGVLRSQVGRFLALYLYGGLYADLDYECFRPFDKFLYRDLLLTEVTPQRNWVSDALMMSAPGHRLFRDALVECGKRRFWPGRFETKYSFEMLTDLVTPELRRHVMPCQLFCPTNWLAGKAVAFGMGRAEVDAIRSQYPDAYAATYWTKNWYADAVVELPKVTLIAMTTREYDEQNLAIERCEKRCRFRNCVVFTDRPELFPGRTCVRIPTMRGGPDVSLHNLTTMVRAQHLYGDYTLNIHSDSWVLNADLWLDEFYQYDYIGAMWPWGVVGNDGFGWKSRRFWEELARLRVRPHVDDCHPSDVVCSMTAWPEKPGLRCYRTELEARGMRWAPPEIANRFSREFAGPVTESFGFHGRILLPEVVELERRRDQQR